eukprot:g40225.t1
MVKTEVSGLEKGISLEEDVASVKVLFLEYLQVNIRCTTQSDELKLFSFFFFTFSTEGMATLTEQVIYRLLS